MALIKGILAKEGKGVEKGSSDNKSPFILFFEIYGRKFWNICQVTLFYMIASIPTFVVMMFLSGLISSHITNMAKPYLEMALATGNQTQDAAMVVAYTAIFDIIVRFVISLVVSALWGMGPVTAGYTYILRNYSREEHAFPWSDFKEHIFKNFKQTLVIWIVDVLVFGLSVFAFLFYSSEGGSIGLVKYFVMFVILAYTIMHIYIYPLTITYKLKIKDIFRNSFLLAVGALPSSILTVLVTIGVNIFMIWFGLKVPFAGASLGYWTCYIILAVVVFPGFTGLLKNFVAQRTIKKLWPGAKENETVNDEKFLY